MDDLNSRLVDVLSDAIRTLFPLTPDPRKLVKKHVWRDRRYVGENDGKVAAWRGMSANLVELDFRYRAVFSDVVENNLPVRERYRLFGPAFTEHTLPHDRFVVLFVLDFPLGSEEEIIAQGFVPRRMHRTLHACVIAHPDEFLAQSVSHWTAKIVGLVLLQRVLSIHRKPLDANEVPFQNLLYRTGYLHAYIVKGGLELHKLSRPRRAGGFGHDFHAVVANPTIPVPRPFPLGIEVYNAAIGYHAESIPGYVNEFGLAGMIVVAKDDPFPALVAVGDRFPWPITRGQHLTELGSEGRIGIHHLPLDNVIADLEGMQDEIGHLLGGTVGRSS